MTKKDVLDLALWMRVQGGNEAAGPNYDALRVDCFYRAAYYLEHLANSLERKRDD